MKDLTMLLYFVNETDWGD